MSLLRSVIFLVLAAFVLVSPASLNADSEPRPVLSEITESPSLRRWLDDVYLPSHDAPQLIEKTGFVTLDVATFKSNVATSMIRYSDGATQHEAALVLRLFPDTEFLLVPERFQIGSSQFANIEARIANCDLTKREHFRFQISPDGRLSGYGTTTIGNFQIQPTAEAGKFLVVKVNTRRAAKGVRID